MMRLVKVKPRTAPKVTVIAHEARVQSKTGHIKGAQGVPDARKNKDDGDSFC